MYSLSSPLSQQKLVHQRHLRRFLSAGPRIEPRGSRVSRPGDPPGLPPPHRAPKTQKGAPQPTADPLTLVGRRDSHLVDPELRGLVGVHVMDRGSEADDHLLL